VPQEQRAILQQDDATAYDFTGDKRGRQRTMEAVGQRGSRDSRMIESRHTLLRLADRRNLDVFVSGPTNGRVLLYHQGTPANSIRPLMASAHRLGLRFVTTWRPGYGGSTRQVDRTVADVVNDTEAVLTFLGVGRCLVAGWSGGGPHALACGGKLAHRVAAVAAIASLAPSGADGVDGSAETRQEPGEEGGAAPRGEAAFRPGMEARRAWILQATPAEFMAGMSSGMPAADQAVFTEAVAEDLQANGLEALHLGVDGWVDDEVAFVKPWGFDVTEVAVPTSLWQGTEDPSVPVGHGEWLAARIPGLVAHIEPVDGHVSICLGHIDQILQELVAMSRGRL
jgi:pimeloyl-ACP methyl ester carboxylesterase